MTIKSCGKLLSSSLAFCIKVRLKYSALYEIGTGMLCFLVSFETWISVYVGNEKAAVGYAAEQQVVCCKTKREFWRITLVWRSTAVGLCKRCAGSGRIKKTETEREDSCEQHCLIFFLFTEQATLENVKEHHSPLKPFLKITNMTSITFSLPVPTCLLSKRKRWEWLLKLPNSTYFLGSIFSY